MYHIKAFRAIDNPEISVKFYEGHHSILKAFGVQQITSASVEWFNNPGVYGVIAESPDGKAVYGGVKIHVANDIQLLPVESAVGYMDAGVYDLINKHKVRGAGEACGLWNAREVAGMGISTILMRAIVSITSQIGVKTLFGLSSDHTLKLFRKVGYRVVHTLGDKGDFIYPTPEYLARVIKMDTMSLKTTDPDYRERIISLREKPGQYFVEKGSKDEVPVQYQLNLTKPK